MNPFIATDEWYLRAAEIEDEYAMNIIDSRIKINKIDNDTNEDKIRFVPLRDIISIIEYISSGYEAHNQLYMDDTSFFYIDALQKVISKIKERYT